MLRLNLKKRKLVGFFNRKGEEAGDAANLATEIEDVLKNESEINALVDSLNPSDIDALSQTLTRVDQQVADMSPDQRGMGSQPDLFSRALFQIKDTDKIGYLRAAITTRFTRENSTQK